MFNTLANIAKILNHEKVLWGVGASIILNHYGLIDKPNDIDILVAEKDIEKADRLLGSSGVKKVRENSDTYATKHFYEYAIEGFDVDVMSGLILNHNNGAFRYIFDESSIVSYTEINGVKIPLTSLEDWYVLYQLIPNREVKVRLIEDYLIRVGIRNSDLLERALFLDLPDGVRENVIKILKNSNS
jgi:hypothetical protein